MTDDAALLRRFVDESSEPAFRELVTQRIDFVYAAALRQVGGDAHLAQEVAQNVFLDLARKARGLTSRPTLSGWLHTSTRFAAAKALRSRIRRLNHETEAHTMQETLSTPGASDLDWRELRPVIDATLHELGERDREAILQRFFEDRSLAEVGAAIGLPENSARMRVDRALEKLRARLAQRGITSTAAALGVALANQPTVAAPAGLAASVAGFSLAGAAAGGGALSAALVAFETMKTGKYLAVAAGLIGAAGIGAFWGVQHRPETSSEPNRLEAARSSAMQALSDENRQLHLELERLRATAAPTQATGSDSTAKAAAVAPPSSSLDRLRVLTDLQSRKLVRPVMTFVNPKGEITDSFTTLFGLNDGERAALQLSVDQAREKLIELEQQNATVSRNEKGDVVIKVKPFAEAGGAAYDELMKSFADTLGPERNAAYLSLGADQVEKALGNFGEPQRIVTFSYSPAASVSGAEPYVLRDELKMPGSSGKGLSTSVSTSDFRSYDEMVERAGTIGKLLPPDFQHGK